MEELIVKRGPFKFKVWINEVKRVVVARFIGMNNNPHNNIRGPVGKAVCNPEDIFDCDVGISLAVDRALIKIGKHWQRNIVADFNKTVKLVSDNLVGDKSELYEIKICKCCGDK